MNRRHLLSVVASILVLPAVPSIAQDAAKGPRAGTYRIMSYGAVKSPPLFLGHFTMASGTYKAYLPGGKLSGEGRYSYNAADQKVIWQPGPYADVWGGAFTVEREGKTHKIRLKSTTIATNSTDSP